MKKAIGLALAGTVGLLPLTACQEQGAGIEGAEARALEAAQDGPVEVLLSGCLDSFATYNATAGWQCRDQGCNANTPPDLIVDGNRETFSTFVAQGVTSASTEDGMLVLSVKPQEGVVFSEDTWPGFWLEKNTLAENPSQLRVETLLNGRVQDVSEDALGSGGGYSTRNNNRPYFHDVQATRPYDELRLVFEGKAIASNFRVYEACVSGIRIRVGGVGI